MEQPVQSTSVKLVLVVSCAFLCFAMSPPLDAAELDFLRKLAAKGLCPVEAHARLAARRCRSGRANADLTTARRALRGLTHPAGRRETHGRKTHQRIPNTVRII